MTRTFFAVLLSLSYFSLLPAQAEIYAQKAAVVHAGAKKATLHKYQLTKLGRRYFAIAGCYRYRKTARRRAQKIHGRVIRSNNYANLDKWRFCAVRGLNWKWFAKNNCRKLKRKGFDCYVKAAY